MTRARKVQEIDRAWLAWHIYALPKQDPRKPPITLADLIGDKPSPKAKRQSDAEIQFVMRRWRVAKAWQMAEQSSARLPGE